jgi:Mg2+-importing ATPase
MIPADLRIIQARDLFVAQASLTGESCPLKRWRAAATRSR